MIENIIIPIGKISGNLCIDIPIFILRFKSCVYEFVRTNKCQGLVGRTMVTQQMWEEVMGYNPNSSRGDNIPVGNISYIQICEFIKKLTNLTSHHCGYKLTYGLMSEIEWELCAGELTNVFNDSHTVINAGLNTGFSKHSAWCADNSNNRLHQVALFAPNEDGLYDMYGNLWDICIRNFHRELSGVEPKREDFDNEMTYKRELLKWKLLGTRNMQQNKIVLKGGAWNMPRESCVKETFLEIGENDKFSNAGFRLTVSIQKI